MNKSQIISQVESLAKSYSDRFLEGTKVGLALMKVLGFKRSDYRIETPEDKKKGGWKATKIYLRDYRNDSIIPKAIKYREVFADCGFNFKVYVQDGKLFLISITETFEREAKIEMVKMIGNKIESWETIYSNTQYFYL